MQNFKSISKSLRELSYVKFRFSHLCIYNQTYCIFIGLFMLLKLIAYFCDGIFSVYVFRKNTINFEFVVMAAVRMFRQIKQCDFNI